MAANSDVARIARERDEARDMVEKLTNQGLELMDENRSLKREYKKTKNEIEGWKNKWECAVEMAAVAENESEEQARLLGMSAERDESLRGKLFMLERELARIKEAAKEVVKVWETPPWKMGETPSNAITKLRDAIRYED
jgi:chromosome segregation ATPase